MNHAIQITEINSPMHRPFHPSGHPESPIDKAVAWMSRLNAAAPYAQVCLVTNCKAINEGVVPALLAFRNLFPALVIHAGIKINDEIGNDHWADPIQWARIAVGVRKMIDHLGGSQWLLVEAESATNSTKVVPEASDTYVGMKFLQSILPGTRIVWYPFDITGDRIALAERSLCWHKKSRLLLTQWTSGPAFDRARGWVVEKVEHLHPILWPIHDDQVARLPMDLAGVHGYGFGGKIAWMEPGVDRDARVADVLVEIAKGSK